MLDEDIEVEWTGGAGQHDVTVHAGPAVAKFGLGTLTLRQPWIWRTPRDRALLLGPVPNAEIRPWRMMDAWVDSAHLNYPWFPSIRLLERGRHVIPAGTAVGSVREVVAWRGAPETIEREQDARTQTRHDRLRKARDARHGLGDETTRIWRRSASRRAALAREGPWLDVLTARKWLRAEKCADLIAAFEPSPARWREGTALWWPDLGLHAELAEALDDIGDAIEDVTALPVKVSNPHVVRWSPGASMPIHSDIGGSNEFPERRWTSVIYLNTVGEGGQTVIPDRGVETSPAAGSMAAWPGGHVGHGVQPAAEDRYTVVCWWGP